MQTTSGEIMDTLCLGVLNGVLGHVVQPVAIPTIARGLELSDPYGPFWLKPLYVSMNDTQK